MAIKKKSDVFISAMNNPGLNLPVFPQALPVFLPDTIRLEMGCVSPVLFDI